MSKQVRHEAQFIIQTNKPFTKENLSLIGRVLKFVTDELDLDRHHLESYITCTHCGFDRTSVNPTQTLKDEWKCRHCGKVILNSDHE